MVTTSFFGVVVGYCYSRMFVTRCKQSSQDIKNEQDMDLPLKPLTLEQKMINSFNTPGVRGGFRAEEVDFRMEVF